MPLCTPGRKSEKHDNFSTQVIKYFHIKLGFDNMTLLNIYSLENIINQNLSLSKTEF